MARAYNDNYDYKIDCGDIPGLSAVGLEKGIEDLVYSQIL